MMNGALDKASALGRKEVGLLSTGEAGHTCADGQIVSRAAVVLPSDAWLYLGSRFSDFFLLLKMHLFILNACQHYCMIHSRV